MPDVAALLWNYCHTLRHDGIDYGDYIEQLTYLLFLKMAEERGIELPSGANWKLIRHEPQALFFYKEILNRLSEQPGILGQIYYGAQSRFANDRSLMQLIELIDRVHWSSLDEDVQAAAFEGLLERSAAEGKKGSGQYFTPRPLIESIVRLVKPDPFEGHGIRINDPACGTAGFLVAAHEWYLQNFGNPSTAAAASKLRSSTYYGQELVNRPRRLALMNLYLRDVEPQITLGDSIYGDPPTRKYDIVLTNPPFGSRGAGEVPEGTAYKVRTTSKQLNFVQMVASTLTRNGRAAIVLPDNALFDDKASAVFRNLMAECDVHTVLRCPTGTFSPYTEGTNTNVIFFTKGRATRKVWIYDARTNLPKVTKRIRPLSTEHFIEFEVCFGGDPYGQSGRKASDSSSNRWRAFNIADVAAKDYKIDALKWISDEGPAANSDSPNDAQQLLRSALESLRLASDDLEDLQGILDGLGLRK